MFLSGTSGALGADRYRVELIVFQNLGVPAESVEVDSPRRFRDALSLDEPVAPAAPIALVKEDGAFANIWARLDRLAEYDPLLRVTFEQSLFDYHPPVRVHGEEPLAETLHFPGNLAYVDPTDAGPDQGWFDSYVERLYRLDGTIQLRRSRFLHIDLDLEYRLDGPAWELNFPAVETERLAEGFQWITEPPGRSAAFEAREEAPATSGQADRQAQAIDARTVLSPGAGSEESLDNTTGTVIGGLEGEEAPVVPFQLHRLDQSRQVRTNTMQYFDSAYLGAIVRVTPISDDVP
ncbi:MAG: CsiV family protein [Pseudomonadota bacterium]